MNVNDAFPSKYIKAGDLGDKRVPVTIDRVEIEQVGQQRDEKPVVYFVGKSKGMVLNKTNAKKISQLAGTAETDQWSGVKVALYASETEFGGDTVSCVRVAAASAPPQVKPAPKPVPVEESFDADADDSDSVPF